MADHRKYKRWTESAPLGQCFMCLVWAPASPHRTEHYLKGELRHSSMHGRARCLPLMKGKPCLLSTLIQNSVKTSWRCHHPHVYRGTVEQQVQWFSRSHFKMMWMSQGSHVWVCSVTWYTQCTTRQLISWGRSLNCPEWNDKKEDILTAGKGQIGRQTPWCHTAMPKWQDGSWLALKRAICSETGSHLSYTFLQPRNCLTKLLLYTCIEVIWDIIKRLT